MCKERAGECHRVDHGHYGKDCPYCIKEGRRLDGKFQCLTDDWLGDKPCPYCTLRRDIDLEVARGVMPQEPYIAPARYGSYGGTK
jgi:hypothetical protein